MAMIQISAEPAAGAAAGIDALVQTLEAQGAYPDLTYDNAPIAAAASNLVGQEWQQRLGQEVTGGESLGRAFALAAEIFEAGDNELASALAELEYVDRVDGGAN